MVKFRTEGEVEGNKVYEDYTFVEKALPPYLNYVVRKVFLGLCLVLLTVCKLVANRFRFSIEASVSDREEWVWLDGFSWKGLFRYRARVEKVD